MLSPGGAEALARSRLGVDRTREAEEIDQTGDDPSGYLGKISHLSLCVAAKSQTIPVTG